MFIEQVYHRSLSKFVQAKKLQREKMGLTLQDRREIVFNILDNTGDSPLIPCMLGIIDGKKKTTEEEETEYKSIVQDVIYIREENNSE